MTSPVLREPAVRDRTLPDVLCYVVLTILVWGVSAFRRGMWQDDVQALGLAFVRSHRSFWKLFGGDASPLRRLTLLPSALANVTPYPIEALQLISAATWLAMGLLAGWIVSLLLPNQRLTRFLVICLTLTATSDYLTASMVPLAYNLAASSFLAALVCALLWLRDGKTLTLVASALLMASSLWNMDVGLPAVPFAAFLAVWISGWRPAKKLLALLASWAIVLIPVAILILHPDVERSDTVRMKDNRRVPAAAPEILTVSLRSTSGWRTRPLHPAEALHGHDEQQHRPGADNGQPGAVTGERCAVVENRAQHPQEMRERQDQDRRLQPPGRVVEPEVDPGEHPHREEGQIGNGGVGVEGRGEARQGEPHGQERGGPEDDQRRQDQVGTLVDDLESE